PATQQVDLQEAHRIDVRVAQTYRASQRFLLREQLVAAGQLEDEPYAALVFGADQRKELVVQRRQPRVMLRDLDIGLREHRFHVVDEDGEEWPVRKHLLERRRTVPAERRIETGRESEPAGQQAAVLRPRENPRDGPQILDPAGPVA